jgi:parallel beta-helix repeat protein
MRRIWLFLIPLCCTQVLQAQIFYVPSQQSAIQSAIDMAKNGDAVIVSPGTYHENIDFKGKSITVQSSDPNDPNIVVSTIIDGSIPADPNFGSVVIFKSGEDQNSVLAGFTVTGGTGSWITIAWKYGGIYWNRCGGGILCYNLSKPTITKNIFINNRAGEGGGIYIYGDPVNTNDPVNPAVHINPVITDNTLFNNTATVNHGFSPPDTNHTLNNHGDGGAIVCFQGVDAVITGNLIQNNHASNYGGGIHCRQWSNTLIAENEIADNNSSLGAGVHITYTSNPIIKDNLIRANIAGPLGGGGIYVYYLSNPLIERNFITQNVSTNGAGIGVYYQSNPIIRDNLIYKNKTGAGILVTGEAISTIIGNTIAGNTPSSLYSGGVECITTSSVPVVTNNIISSNGRYGIYALSIPPATKYNDIWGNSSGNYNSIVGDQTGINGNISLDPCFIKSDANDYHLDYNSPCKNAGDPNFIAATGETDIDFEPRIFNARVDIGADEVVTSRFDLNNDGLVDYYELGLLTNDWLRIGPGLQTDFNSDGIVNFDDFAELTGQWFWTAGWRTY